MLLLLIVLFVAFDLCLFVMVVADCLFVMLFTMCCLVVYLLVCCLLFV